jgi:glycosyltransferase involved in cell wall biosynthesis
MDMPEVSVVIPVFDDEARLHQCLRAIEDQTYPTDAVHVIVVDDGSSHPPVDAISSFPAAELVIVAPGGSYAARNAGLDRAEGSIVAFTDSDCIPDPRWLEQAVKALLAGGDVIAGHVEVVPRDPDHPTFAELYDLARGFPQTAYVKQGFGVTANLCTTREVLDAVGPFRDDLQSGGDRDWGTRATACGFRVRFEPSAVVRHPARDTWSQHWRKAVRTSRGMADLTSPELAGSAAALLRGFTRAPIKALGVASRLRREGFGGGVLPTVAAQWTGYLMLCGARTFVWAQSRRPARDALRAAVDA